jgi:murein DD-endopeptidase MepM/ murein hydrolase activator NlpD
MTSEPPPRDSLRPLRPLPSIDVPLLRSERSALRHRQVIVIAIAGVLLVGGGISLGFGLHSQGDKSGGASGASSEQPSASGDAPGAGDTNAARVPLLGRESGVAAGGTPGLPADAVVPSRVNASFGKAASFRDALEKSGCSRDESNALIEALTGIIDFKRAHPEHTLTIERDPLGEIARFEYRASLTQRYEAARDVGGALRGRQIEVPVRSVRVARGGIVSGSLGDTFEGLKLGRALVGVFGEVFAGHVNFSTDTRTGDQFRVIFDEEQIDGTILRQGTVHAVEYKGEKTGLMRAFWYEIEDEGDFYDEQGRAMHGGWLRTPLRYDHVSSGFGMRFHPVLKRKKLHNGIDYAAASGTPVRAAADGTVTFAGPKGPNGNLLILRHATGFESFYAHLSRFATGLRAGRKVRQREIIAYVGSTGRSTGPHLHFSLKKSGKFVDPATQLNGPGAQMSAEELPDFKRRVRELSSALSKVNAERPAPVQVSAGGEQPADLGEEEL